LAIEEYWLVDAVGSGIGSLRRRELAIDVGANVGDWTSEFAKIFTRVVAYEPDSRARVRITESDNVTVIAAAVSSTDGTASFFLRPDAGQNSLLEHHPIGAGSQSPAPVTATIDVRTVSLDEAHPEGADVVKIDVEGAECDVLLGCSADGRWSRTLFIVECHDTRPAVADQLWRLGKRVELHRHPSPTAHPGHCWLIGRANQ
jgi:FkbM family methyltransferase